MSKPRLSKEEWAERSAAKVAAAQATLAESVSTLVTGEDWMAYLAFQARLHCYSPNNVMLIASQHAQAFVEGRVADPVPSFVAGFNTWKALGRSVDKGQRGYAVLAPLTGHRRTAADEDGHIRPLGPKEAPRPGETEERRMALYGFKVEHVFEVGQTSGRPVPDVPRPKLLVGEAPEGLGVAVMALIESRGFTVDTVPDAGAINGANGQTNWGSRSVVGRADMDDAAMVKTLIHEAAHCLLHADPPGSYLPRPFKEVEAESVAFVVAAAHGMPTDGYTFPYVAGWAAGDDPAKAVQATQARVGRAARSIIEASPAPHDPGGKVPGAAAAVEVARQARLDQDAVTGPVEAGVGV